MLAISPSHMIGIRPFSHDSNYTIFLYYLSPVYLTTPCITLIPFGILYVLELAWRDEWISILWNLLPHMAINHLMLYTYI